MTVGRQSIEKLQDLVSDNREISNDIVSEWTERFSELPEFDEQMSTEFIRNAILKPLPSGRGYRIDRLHKNTTLKYLVGQCDMCVESDKILQV